jgi:transposase-like protein
VVDRPVTRAVAALRARPDQPVSALADEIGLSERQLAWSQLAIAAGYADQSHMINQCLALTGGPPTALPVSVLSNTLEEPSS